ncbi:uncharacterized protein LODBEIA_P23880 [Lodderomyces beijingensis]|uniref:Spindle pole body-associated protein Vik1/Cik1 microtubule binding domain-containing protein n=1 Tax=Lodderomyces beijingensis TaxID=1775926 RepID=A0ABP0ZJW8_9ASCO
MKSSTSRTKRPLEEADINMPYTSTPPPPPKRRLDSLATATTAPAKSLDDNNFFESRLPKPGSTTKSTTKASSLVNDSATATANQHFLHPPATRDYHQRILSLQDRLSKKASSTASSAPGLPRRSSLPSQGTHLRSHSSTALNDSYLALCERHQEKQREIDMLNDELQKLRRIYRNYVHKVDIIQDEMRDAELKFKDMEETIVKNVEYEEHMIDIKLEQNRIKLDNQFRELEFEMLQELDEAKKFDFGALNRQIEDLKQESRAVCEKVKTQEMANEVKYKEQADRISMESGQKLEELKFQVRESQSRLDLKQKEHERAANGNKEAQDMLNLARIEVDEKKKLIRITEEKLSNFHQLRKNLASELNEVQAALENKLQESQREQAEFDKVKATYDEMACKIKRHDEHRRILENSIMDYQQKIRVYAFVSPDVGHIEESRYFSKVFAPDTPMSFVMDEFTHLMTGVMRGTNVSIISQSLPGNVIAKRAINELRGFRDSKMQNWDIKLGYQSGTLDKIIDSLGPGEFLHNCGVDIDALSLDQVSQNISEPHTDEPVVHFIVASGVKEQVKFESKLLVLDICAVSSRSQLEILKTVNSLTPTELPKNNSLSTLIVWMLVKSKMLILSKPTDREMSNVLKSLSSTSIACIKKWETK